MTFKDRLSHFPFIHLTYLVLPLVSIFFEHIQLPFLLSIFIWFIFMVTTALLTMLNTDELEVFLHVIILFHCTCIILLACYVNPSSVILFVFLTFYLPTMLKEAFKPYLLGVYVLSLVIILMYTIVSGRTLMVYVAIIELILVISLVINVKNQEKQVLIQEIEHQKRHINQLMAEQERQRIAQDLHDTLGHIFASISIKSELAQKLCPHYPSKAQLEMKDIQTISNDTLNQVRLIVDNIQWITFASEVNRMIMMLKESDIQFNYQGIECMECISIENQTKLAMILREAINNVIKHSNASIVSLNVAQHNTTLYMRIHDNGTTISSKKIEVKSIQERVASLNGHLTLRTNDAGVALCIELDMEGLK